LVAEKILKEIKKIKRAENEAKRRKCFCYLCDWAKR